MTKLCTMEKAARRRPSNCSRNPSGAWVPITSISGKLPWRPWNRSGGLRTRRVVKRWKRRRNRERCASSDSPAIPTRRPLAMLAHKFPFDSASFRSIRSMGHELVSTQSASRGAGAGHRPARHEIDVGRRPCGQRKLLRGGFALRTRFRSLRWFRMKTVDRSDVCAARTFSPFYRDGRFGERCAQPRNARDTKCIASGLRSFR